MDSIKFFMFILNKAEPTKAAHNYNKNIFIIL